MNKKITVEVNGSVVAELIGDVVLKDESGTVVYSSKENKEDDDIEVLIPTLSVKMIKMKCALCRKTKETNENGEAYYSVLGFTDENNIFHLNDNDDSIHRECRFSKPTKEQYDKFVTSLYDYCQKEHLDYILKTTQPITVEPWKPEPKIGDFIITDKSNITIPLSRISFETTSTSK